MFDKTKPLWLPAGSVRAIMSLAVIAVILYEIVGGGGLTDLLAFILTGVLVAYGAMRLKQVTNQPDEMPPILSDDMIDVLNRMADVQESGSLTGDQPVPNSWPAGEVDLSDQPPAESGDHVTVRSVAVPPPT